ncbi:hypothetical protein ACVWXL_002825 [Bradyrhizobium sp. GM22.5]
MDYGFEDEQRERGRFFCQADAALAGRHFGGGGCAIGTASQADAAFYYWTDYSDGSYGRQERHLDVPRQKPQKRGAVGKKDLVAEKEAGTKPQGPLVIVVSIDRQKVTVYDSKGVFAESPVSTGMKGHSTPMGVFSVIQKHKFHHSNIYSGAPMPYMQRITWSGVAMHAGVLPGYPASHGCIRMPMAFAVKMWNWTRMGARVIVSPGQMSPQKFSHPLLASLRVPPQPAASLEPQTNAGDKADKGTANTAATEAKPVETKTASADGVPELRSSVGHTVMSDVTTGYAPAREEAPASADNTETTAKPETKPAEAADAAKPEAGDAAQPANTEAKPVDAAETPKSELAKTSDAPAAAPAQAATTDVKKDEKPALPIRRPWQNLKRPSERARSRSSSAARIPSSTCGRTLRRCSRCLSQSPRVIGRSARMSLPPKSTRPIPMRCIGRWCPCQCRSVLPRAKMTAA